MGYFVCMGHYFGWVGVDGALFCMNGGGWENILGGWGWVGVDGDEWGLIGISGGGCTV